MKSDRTEIALALSFFLILALMVVPLPATLLDLLLSFSLTVSLVTLMLALYAERPLDFSVFPSLLLIATLMRLGLNVASTRLILLRGAEGSASAGNVIRAFGDFTVGGNYVVGLVLFAIFVVINFVVIAKGSGRIAEVAARFTLDALPGKQMAIDADLNQGVIGDAEARRRRSEIQREADFYGAMDGASKFVRGDAIAGLIIMAVNIVGGLSIGVLQNGLAVGQAVETYTVLTVGDGLVSQIPALVISTAAGVIVSRAAGGAPLAVELRDQMLLQPKPLALAAGMLGTLALVPGLPFVPFAALAGGAGVAARFTAKRAAAAPEPEPPQQAPVDDEAEVRRSLVLDDLEVEIGYGAIPLVDDERGGDLVGRIRALRAQLAAELGFVIPPVHIRDNLELDANAYSILVRGNPVATGAVYPSRWLALRPAESSAEIPGIAVQDAAFGLPALWIQSRDRERAEAAGYAVVDASSALATHLAEVIRRHAPELLSRQHVRDLLDQLAERQPKVVEDIVPGTVSVATLHTTLRALLSEGVSIRDLSTILETLAEFSPKLSEPEALVECVRERMARTITRPYLDRGGVLHVLTLEPGVEESLRAALAGGDGLALDATRLDSLVRGFERAFQGVADNPDAAGPVLLTVPGLRAPLRRILERIEPRVAVLSHNELPREIRLQASDVVRWADAH